MKRPLSGERGYSRPSAIVGIGASAGGLEAFKQLLANLPADTGMGFVFVQHLQARHESMLTKILSTATSMPTVEIRNGMPVEPNHVYVIAPNTGLQIKDGVLKVISRKGRRERHLPIDDFFASLAEDQGSRAIGIVLSGTAADGTFGLKTIRVEGGITFAQEPESAKFDGMPANAIMADCVDFVLTPEHIATKLTEISRHPYVKPATAREDHPILSARDEEWMRLFKLLKASSGVDFTFYKKNTIKRRVARRMALHKAEQLGDYLKVLQSNGDELDALHQDILIHVTSFFREPEVFRAFQTKIVPQILSGKKSGEPVRLWVAGCSTGEEVYSLAICFLDTLSKRKSLIPLQIFATDVSEQSIAKARAGIYPPSAMKHITPERVRRFFTSVEGSYQINSTVRDVCVFARHDLTRDPPFSRLDVVACRNVLIYLEPVLQKRVVASFHYALKDTGFLILGKSETLGSYSELFSILDGKNKFFSRKPSTGVAYELSPTAHDKLTARDKRETTQPAAFDLEKEADRYVWERYSHAGLVVDNDLQILQFRGDTARYLRPMPGKATFHLLRMLREELVFEVRAAIHKVRKTDTSVRRETIRVKFNGTTTDVSIEVLPLFHPGKREKYFLVLFEDAIPDENQPATGRKVQVPGTRDSLKLQNELARTREYLQSIVQEQESTNEELKTANEEALSSMEELQSSNEELETAKEELQSSNEELVTLNEQLQTRTAELARTNDDLASVFSSVNIPIIMLGVDRRVRRFTPSAEKVLHLIPGDIGRPLRAMRIGFDLPGLEDMIATVMKQGAELREEAKSDNDRWYSIRLFPYRTSDQKIDGVLLAFVDIHELRQSQEAVRTEMSLTSAILDAASDLLVVVRDRSGRIVRFNHACQKLTGYSEDEVRGRHAWEFLPPLEAVPEAKASFSKAITGSPNKVELPWLTRDGRRLIISWSNTVTRNRNVVEYLVSAGIDVTERREAAEQVREKEATVQALLESAAQAILAMNQNGEIVLANAAAESIFGYSRDELIGLSAEILLPRPLLPKPLRPKTLLPKTPLPKTLRRDNGGRRRAWFSNPENWSPGDVQELNGQRKDGSEFPVEISLSSIETKDGVLYVSFISDISRRKEDEMAVKSMTTRLVSMQEQSGKTIARELHDGITQKLAALSMETSTLLKGNAAPQNPLAARIRDLGSKIGSLTEDVHRMSRQLHPKILDDLGLEVAVREECITLSKQLDIPVEFEATDIPSDIPEDIALCLFRVSQEALRNIARHAQPKQVRVSLSRIGKELLLSIEDVGEGFDLDEARRKGGLGLVSMEERVRLVGGTFQVHPQPGKGTQIEVQVRLPEKPS